jgi:predicted DCC family thiol-disulfide oxidoreductase YuxK
MRFVMARDADNRFRFTAIQSAYGRAIATSLGIDPDDPDTNAVVFGGRVYRRSDAALAVLGTLPRWRWVRVLAAVPRPLRDRLYDFVAQNRYGLFGKHQSCDLGETSFRHRVISDLPPGA